MVILPVFTEFGLRDKFCLLTKLSDETHLLCRNLFTSSADTLVSNKKCSASARPPTEQDCRPCQGFCSQYGILCSANGGGCFSDQCICPDGWGGIFCDVDLQRCSSGLTDRYNNCCESKVINKRGECCTEGTPSIDWNGECCPAGFVDECGICGGSGFAVDFEGTCCQVRCPDAFHFEPNTLGLMCSMADLLVYCMPSVGYVSAGQIYSQPESTAVVTAHL